MLSSRAKLLSCLFVVQVAAAKSPERMEGCDRVLAVHQDLQLMEQVARLEKKIDFWRRFAGNRDRAERRQIELKLQELHTLLVSDERRIAVDAWRGFMRQFEFNWARLSSVRAPERAALLESLGKDYSEYHSVRTYLEKLAQDGAQPKLKERAQYLLDSLGIDADARLTYPALSQGLERPQVSELEQTLLREPRLLLAKLKQTLRRERWAGLRALSLRREFLQLAESIAVHVPFLNRTRIVKIFKPAYDASAREEDFPDIGLILRADGGTENQYDLLLGFSAINPDLLRSFSRRTDSNARKAWKDLKDYAQTNDPDFHQQMLVAQEEGKPLGRVPLLYKRSLATQITVLTVSVLSAWGGYLAHEHRKLLHLPPPVEVLIPADGGKARPTTAPTTAPALERKAPRPSDPWDEDLGN